MSKANGQGGGGKLDESNKGHRMLQKMGWTEGRGLGKEGAGIVEPVQAEPKQTRAGIGQWDPHRISKDDDAYSQYKKRNAIGYHHRSGRN